MTAKSEGRTLLCWHSVRAGKAVLDNALAALAARRRRPRRVVYLAQPAHAGVAVAVAAGVAGAEVVIIDVDDPTAHAALRAALLERIVPLLRGQVDINISPGTPAMHAVWLLLHAGGAFPAGSRLWSSQQRPDGSTTLDEVDVPVTTYLQEIRRAQRRADVVTHDPEARSPLRRAALEDLARFARVPGAPLLVLGERGTGKTSVIETQIAVLKGRKNVVTVACGGLDSSLAEAALFGQVKGAFTGADKARAGLLQEAHGGLLFLDEVQDLPVTAQRKLVRVLQDRRRRFRRLGDDAEISVDFELVCASNLPLRELRERLDADLFDRIAHLRVTLPPLRQCRADLPVDWQRMWRGEPAPTSTELLAALAVHPLPGNLRDLERLALLVRAHERRLTPALAAWTAHDEDDAGGSSGGNDAFALFGSGTRKERTRVFQRQLARRAYECFGTWSAAARMLDCDERTLRDDAGDG